MKNYERAANVTKSTHSYLFGLLNSDTRWFVIPSRWSEVFFYRRELRNCHCTKKCSGSTLFRCIDLSWSCRIYIPLHQSIPYYLFINTNLSLSCRIYSGATYTGLQYRILRQISISKLELGRAGAGLLHFLWKPEDEQFWQFEEGFCEHIMLVGVFLFSGLLLCLLASKKRTIRSFFGLISVRTNKPDI